VTGMLVAVVTGIWQMIPVKPDGHRQLTAFEDTKQIPPYFCHILKLGFKINLQKACRFAKIPF
jgi:hypothetical protein